MDKLRKLRRRTFEIVNRAENGDILSKIFDDAIMALILLSVLSVVLESFAGIRARFETAFRVSEIVVVSVFTVEYLLRIWTADFLFPESRHPRLKYLLSPLALADLAAILPFFLPFVSVDLRFLRMARLYGLVRLLRVFKLGRYSDAMCVVGGVIKRSASQLAVSVVLCLAVMLFSAIVMYTVENAVQPDQFPNVVATLWWALCTLTTVGYGDVFPVTPIGRLFASIISLAGIGILAIPTGIVTAGFSSVINGDATNPRNEKVAAGAQRSDDEAALVSAFRQADARARADALIMLQSHPNSATRD